MKIMTVTTDCNGYLVFDDHRNAVIIDPGADAEKFGQIIVEQGLKPEKILLTHGHFDHFGAAQALKERFACPLWISEADAPMLSDGEKNAATPFGYSFVPTQADGFVSDGEFIRVGDLCFEVIATPGHTRGGVTYRIEKALFTGDTLFRGTVGRTDLYGGNPLTLMRSLTKLLDLPGDFTVYPGHGEITTLRREEAENHCIRKRGHETHH